MDGTGRVYSDLIYTNATSFAGEVAPWTKISSTSPFYYLCSKNYIIGGYNIGGRFSRTLTSLPSHDLVFLTFRSLAMDNWSTGDNVAITIGAKTYSIGGLVKGTLKKAVNCGGPGNAKTDFGEIKGKIQVFHNTSSVLVDFNPSIGNQGSFGFRELIIAFGYKTSSDKEYACFISVNSFALSTVCNCTDPLKYYDPITKTCIRCSSTCTGSCTDSATTQCVGCKTGYYYNGFTCLPCQTGCASCNSSSYCFVCNTGLYKYSNGSCGVCNAPMNISGVSCISICNSTSYLYWDRTCLTNCSLPLLTSYVGLDKLCVDPCIGSAYLYADSSCSTGCVLPYTNYTFKAKNFCANPCRGPGVYEYDNFTCGLTCPSPLIIIIMGTYNHCGVPCSAGLYRYQNGSCLPTCSLPFQVSIIQTYLFCNYICNLTQYLMTNNLYTCSATCSATYFTISQTSLYRSCTTLCPGAYTLRDLTCASSCNSPWISLTDPYLACETPCPNQGDYLMPD
jgi:hypothetical protein